ncbi:MAG: hypothetical protein JWP68_1669 [Modestobacter sp.]|nr:hypothetical protein [Modestobacter sp.]MCW2508521.1 hypothetical protein [Modestobacter sp.]
MTPRRAPAALCWGVLAVVVAVSVATEFGRILVLPADDGAPVGTRVVRFVSYFTIQSNVLVLALAATLARDPDRDDDRWRVVRLNGLLGITITGLVYAIVLAPTLHPEGLGWWTNAGLHYVAPVVTLVLWIVFGPRPRITGATVARALAWPVLWIGYTLAHGAVSGWYPYPFLDVSDLGYAVALRNLGFVVLLALLFLLAFRTVDRRLPATAPVSVETPSR